MHFIKHSQPQDGGTQANRPRTRAFRSLLLYAKVAGAVALGWLAFQPLTSSAQENVSPQAKVISASQMAGLLRIQIENRDSANCPARSDEYTQIMDVIGRRIPNGLGRLDFARKLYSVISDSYPYGNAYYGFMSLSMIWKIADCDNYATMGFDEARRRGVPAAVAFGRTEDGPHAMLKLWDFYLDFNDGAIYDSASIKSKFKIYHETSDPAQISFTAYENLGYAAHRNGEYARAVYFFTKAIDLVPNAAYLYLSRGASKMLAGQLDAASDDFSKVLSIDPDYPDVSFYTNQIRRIKPFVK